MTSAFQTFIRSWRHHPTTQVANMIVLVGAYTVVTLFACIQSNLRSLLDHWGESVQMTVYLQNNAPPETESAVKKLIEQTSEFESYSYISPQQAAQQFKTQMGAFSSHILSDPEFENPFPGSFEIRLKERFTKADVASQIRAIASSFGNLDGVDEVSYGQGWIENYSFFLKAFNRMSRFLILVLALGCLFLVSHSIRNSIYQRRDEIEILELVGATQRMIRYPYLVEGALLGGLAACAALVSTYCLYNWQLRAFDQIVNSWGLQTKFVFLSFWWVVSILVFGVALGWLGSFLSLRAFATGWSAADRANH